MGCCMKIDRLLAITIYLLNHGSVSAAYLARRFDVSKRTIQKDIDSLCAAGIPITSGLGISGEFEIIDSFSLKRQTIDEEDYERIIIALKGLCSSYRNVRALNTLEKLLLRSSIRSEEKVFLDFGVLNDNKRLTDYTKIIEFAIDKRICLRIVYLDSNNVKCDRIIEPVAIIYKWYSWYMFGYRPNKDTYKLYKIIRIDSLNATIMPFKKDHINPQEILTNYLSKSSKEYFDIRLLCKSEVKYSIMEYLGGIIEKEFDNGDFILNLHLPKHERVWFSILVGFSDKVKVIEPDIVRDKLMETAKNILLNYK